MPLSNSKSFSKENTSCFKSVDNCLLKKQLQEQSRARRISRFSHSLKRSVSVSHLTGRFDQREKFSTSHREKSRAKPPNSFLLNVNAKQVKLQQQVKKPLYKGQSCKSHSFNLKAQSKLPQFISSDHSASVRSLFFTSIQLKLHLFSILPAIQNLRMGQTLSEPVTKKETSSDENHSLKVGASCMQGWRISILLINLDLFLSCN